VPGLFLAATSLVNTPVPAPYSTIHRALSKLIKVVMAAARYLLLGAIAPIVSGVLMYSLKNFHI